MAHPTMAALPLISSAVLLNLTGPTLIPSLGLPNALYNKCRYDPISAPLLAHMTSTWLM